MADFDYDLFVIGGGSGGVRAARTAAATGANVALAEESRLGGTCVIRGCVPKKLMVYASTYPDHFEDARSYGWQAECGTFDWSVFRGKLRSELDRLEGVYASMLDKSEVKLFDQRVRVTGSHEIALSRGGTVSAKHILVASGGSPVRPPLSNAELGLVSNDMFLLEELPKSLLIVGGGYIGCEFASIMAGLGVKVSMYVRGGQILNGFDEECRGLIAEMLQQRGIDIHTGTTIVDMDRADAEERLSSGAGSDAAMGAPVSDDPDPQQALDSNPKSETVSGAGCPIWVKTTTGKEQVFDHVLFATGRRPNTVGMGLEEIGVEMGRDGAITVDDYSQSSVPSIYAIGDVTDRVPLTPVAIREAMAFTKTVFEGQKTPVDHELIPSAVFTQPELGSIGLTEAEAVERGGVEIYTASFRPMQQAFADRSGRTLMKLVVDAQSRVVLGCHIVAGEAGEMIQLAGIAVKNKLTKEQFDATCAVHPSSAEELVTMSRPARKG